MFEIGVVGQFEAAHRLRGDFGPATRLHGHTYRIEVSVRGPSLGENGTLCDIGELQAALRDVTDAFHYRDLDEIAGFEGQNTTAETVARYVFDQIAPRFGGQNLLSLEVRVWESPQAYASYASDLR